VSIFEASLLTQLSMELASSPHLQIYPLKKNFLCEDLVAVTGMKLKIKILK